MSRRICDLQNCQSKGKGNSEVQVKLQAQRFLTAHAEVNKLLNLGRHLLSVKNHRLLRQRAFADPKRFTGQAFLGKSNCSMEFKITWFVGLRMVTCQYQAKTSTTSIDTLICEAQHKNKSFSK